MDNQDHISPRGKTSTCLVGSQVAGATEEDKLRGQQHSDTQSLLGLH